LSMNVIALASLDRTMAEHTANYMHVLGILDCNRGGGTVAKQVRVNRMPETLLRQCADPEVDSHFGHG